MKFYKLRFNQAFKLIHCDQFMTSLFNSEIIKQIVVIVFITSSATPTQSRLPLIQDLTVWKPIWASLKF